MSSLFDAACENCSDGLGDIELSILPRTVDLGGFEVHRALPHKTRRMVGPFIFWDQMGPGAFAAGQGIDVRPHPHIGLSTVTYLFEGSLDHRDSLANSMRIVPGDVNLMTAGRGIVHSERTGKEIRSTKHQLAGIQSWLALPQSAEGAHPDFTHYPADTLPAFDGKGLWGRVVLGVLDGLSSPVKTPWDTLYVDIKLEANYRFTLPEETEERGLQLYRGSIEIEHTIFSAPEMIVFRPGSRITCQAKTASHLLLLGGAPLDGPRYIWWNFVSSSIDSIKQAALDWENGLFPIVPDDDREFIPLPDLPFPSP